MFCQKCGKEIFDDAVVCMNCGCATRNAFPIGGQVSNEKASASLQLLSFFVPIIGIIIYFTDKEYKPISAKQCLDMAIAHILLVIAIYIFSLPLSLL